MANAALHQDIGGIDTVHPLSASGVCRIGREDGNEIVVNAPSASRYHALVQPDAAGGYRISDLRSANGTTVNGRRLAAPVRLNDGDVVVVAGQALVFRHTAAAQPFAAPADAQRTTFLLGRSLVTVLVIDIRGSTKLAQSLGEDRLAALMGDLFRLAGRLLEKQNCWAQKYIGDAVMGIWLHAGVVIPADQFGRLLGLIGELETLFATLTVEHGLETPLRFGAGLHSGYAATGNMGGDSAADFTAMGETVNRAFRLESATHELDCDVLISETTLRLIDPPLPVEPYSTAVSVVLKGFNLPESVYPFDFANVASLAPLAVH